MKETSSTGRLVFPREPDSGDKHNHNGVDYIFQNGRWVVIPPDPLDFVTDTYVRVEGDTMTGSLECPMFIGNYDLEALDTLPGA